jgi:hypothetical protein
MPRRSLRELVAVGLVVLSACEPVRRISDDKGTFRLSAEAPTGQLAATFCMDGAELSSIRSNGRVRIDTRTIGDARPETSLRVITEEESETFALDPGSPHSAVLKIDATGPWVDESGPRCGEPRMVRFELVDPIETTEVEIAWKIEIIVEEAGTTLLGSRDLARAAIDVKVDRSGVPVRPVFEE